ncbi:peptidase, M16 family protein [uncultured Algoriphagus sp.]|mgnify:CR=1 FL=1|uniref:peptidase, M16 family protein n=1 Tax=uncultured Algoriphagus sp. TaxID=417365 RepID=UPI0030EF16A0|tara:strand:- start:1813 stop:2541 length:729 start_codon:yes stop_codon:yes gene_type:complete
MKKTIIILAFSLWVAPMASEAHVVAEEGSIKVKDENSVKEVIDNYIKATGGESKMKAIYNVEMNMEAEIQGMKLLIQGITDQKNERMLNVTEVNGNVMSKTVVKDGAGTVSAMGQEQTLTDEQVAAVLKNQIYAFRELYLDDLGIAVTFEGTAEVEGEQAYKLAFDAGGDGNTTEYYSVASGLKLQTESPAAGKIVYKDYKEVDGLMMPMTMVITNSMLPMPLKANITSIEFNQELDDSVFN